MVWEANSKLPLSSSLNFVVQLSGHPEFLLISAQILVWPMGVQLTTKGKGQLEGDAR